MRKFIDVGLDSRLVVFSIYVPLTPSRRLETSEPVTRFSALPFLHKRHLEGQNEER